LRKPEKDVLFFIFDPMINFKSFDLDNSLKVLVHEDHDTNLVVMNILYDVGSRDEHPEKTGFAHLFEHLMFGGSRNIPSFDVPLQAVGGDNNAFTSTDLTNYYLTVPSNNIETAFWLESDRMLSLSFDPQVLEIQRNVVIEEYKQRYLNQPYGDVWLKLKPLAYHQHPYKWLTIGKDIAHYSHYWDLPIKSHMPGSWHGLIIQLQKKSRTLRPGFSPSARWIQLNNRPTYW